MKKNVLCVIYDVVSGEYSSPITFLNIECAKRYFMQLKTKSPNWTDHELYLVGYYNSENAFIEALENKEFIMRGGIVE